jgi:hypothetical protein
MAARVLICILFGCPDGIELVFHTENSMKYQSLHTILKYCFNIPFRYEIPIFSTWKIKFGMLKRYLRIVCKDWYFILFSVWNTNSIPPGRVSLIKIFEWRQIRGRPYNVTTLKGGRISDVFRSFLKILDGDLRLCVTEGGKSWKIALWTTP